LLKDLKVKGKKAGEGLAKRANDDCPDQVPAPT